MELRELKHTEQPFAKILQEAYIKRCKKERRDIPFKELADEIGVNPNQISRYMSGSVVPYKDTPYILEAIAKGYKMPYALVYKHARNRPKRGVTFTEDGQYVPTPKPVEVESVDLLAAHRAEAKAVGILKDC
jgi:transcriptional regulator with XRE-family HTH domain